MIAGAVTVALAAVSSFVSPGRTWGASHLAFYQWAPRVVVLALMAVALVPRFGAVLWRVVKRAGIAASTARSSSGIIVMASTAVAAFVLRSRTLLFGDANFLVTNYTVAIKHGLSTSQFLRAVLTDNPVAPLSDALHFTAARAAHAVGLSAATGVALEVSLWAAVAAGVVLFASRAWRGAPAVIWATALVCTSGAAALLCGYVENYAPAVVTSGACIAAMAWSLRVRRQPVPALALFVLAMLFHVQSILLLPALVFTAITVIRPVRARLISAIISMALVAITAFFALSRAAMPGVLAHLRMPGNAFGLPTSQLLAGAANEVILLIPAFPLVVWIAWYAARHGGRDATTSLPGPPTVPATEESNRSLGVAFAMVLFVPAALFFLAFHPSLGVARDWDLYAITLYGILAIPVAVTIFEFARVPEYALGTAVALSALMTLSWIGVGASNQRAVSRYRAVLQTDKSDSGYAWEILSDHYARRANPQAAIKALSSAYAAEPNPRYLHKLARQYVNIKNFEAAIPPLKRALVSRPASAAMRKLLLRCLLESHHAADAVDIAREGTRRHPADPVFYYYLGKSLVDTGDRVAGGHALQRCLGLNPPGWMRIGIARMVGDSSYHRIPARPGRRQRKRGGRSNLHPPPRPSKPSPDTSRRVPSH